MIARMLSLAVAAVLLNLMPAQAAVDPASTGTAPELGPASAPGIQLAQLREVDIYVDEYGREVLVDAWTGEVVSIIDPRERDAYGRRYDRGWGVRERPRDPYYMDERTLRALERRERRLRELGRDGDGLPRYRDYGEPFYDEYPEEPEPRWAEPAPRWQEPAPRTVSPGIIERRPLTDTARLEEPGPSVRDQIIIEEDADERALPDPTRQPDPAALNENVAKVQILLGRIGLSPGAIDGRMGDNVNKAISTYREMTGRGLRTYDMESIEKLLEETGGPAFKTYEITSADAAGPFVASIPQDFGQKARMEHLGYTSVLEMLAERFHMDERYLKALNPDVDFTRPGQRIVVANVQRPERRPVTRIVADKSAKQVRGYGADGRLVVAYPATIGSEATPSPTGTHTVERIALDPEYTYNPNINFRQGDNNRILTIPPGPNGPVGSVWIGLSKPTYGIHGTPEPNLIGRTYSNGCVRLTNWDARELAGLVEKGVSVEFVN
jgi:lipoprotein-anchoring transpeptidase ErfK/SrfK